MKITKTPAKTKREAMKKSRDSVKPSIKTETVQTKAKGPETNEARHPRAAKGL